MCCLYGIILVVLQSTYKNPFPIILAVFTVIFSLSFVHGFEQPSRMDLELEKPPDLLLQIFI